jgi:hypothetical protein
MPAKAAWLLEVPRILDELTGLEASVVDRAVFEKIFHVRRRRAIQLMHHFGGYQMGKTFIIERQALMDVLAEVRDGAEFRGESRRKERLARLLDELRKHRKAAAVSIAVNDDTFGRTMVNLPDGVSFAPGALEVRFESTEELLAKLFALAQTIANDYEGFEELAQNGHARRRG